MSTSPCYLSNGTFTCAHMEDTIEPLQIIDTLAFFANSIMYYDWVNNFHYYRLDMYLMYSILPIMLYLLSPKAAEIHIHLKEKSDFIIEEGDCEGEDEDEEADILDELDNTIIEQLLTRPSGTTARMLTLAIRAIYPEVELADMNDRLHVLQTKNIVTRFSGQLRASLWVVK